MSSILHLEGKLERLDPSTPWGFRVQGGKDFGSPLTISRVTEGSLAQKCGLNVGDMIIKIGNLSAEKLKHQDAQDTIKASGNYLDLLLQRGGGFPKYDTTDAPIRSPTQRPQQQPITFSAPPTSNYNAAPKPFSGGSGPAKTFTPMSAKAPTAAGGDNPDAIRSMKNLNLSQSPAEPTYDKFAALDDRTARAAGDISRAVNKSHSPINCDPKPTPPAPPKYNSPAGLYSPNTRNDVASSHTATEKGGDSSDPKVYYASETYRLVHERDGDLDSPPGAETKRKYSSTLTKLQQQLDGDSPGSNVYQAKPIQTPPKWETPKSAPTAAPAAKPWQPAPAPRPTWAPPKPTGTGTQRGKQGDALMREAVVGDARIPMCSSCHIAIRGPFVVAMGKSWCPDHFVCANPQCGTKLLDIGFVEEGGALYCERDYEMYFAPRCTDCHRAIIGTCVNALNKTWHPECFTCAHCRQPISGGSFHVEDGKPYCDTDWAAMFQTMCTSCEYPIEPGDRWVEAMNKNWHAECFNCSMCQVNLEGQPFFPKGGKPYCKKHSSAR